MTTPTLATTRLNRPWLLKTLISALVLLGFGVYGLYDATVAYPARGMRYASFQKFQYLETAKREHRLDKSRASVDEPVVELARIRELDRGRYTPMDGPKRDWLEALEVVGKLTPAMTKIDEPEKEHADLTKEWTRDDGSGNSKAAPKPLSWYDIPVQWVFVAIGFGFGAWLLLLFANVARQKYQWDEASQSLHLPDGNVLTPSDIEDFDKRKWDKYLIFLKIKPTHATLGGHELKLDLYRYTPLEEWVLSMERTAFPERAEESDAAIAGSEPGVPGDSPTA